MVTSKALSKPHVGHMLTTRCIRRRSWQAPCDTTAKIDTPLTKFVICVLNSHSTSTPRLPDAQKLRLRNQKKGPKMTKRASNKRVPSGSTPDYVDDTRVFNKTCYFTRTGGEVRTRDQPTTIYIYIYIYGAMPKLISLKWCITPMGVPNWDLWGPTLHTNNIYIYIPYKFHIKSL